MIGNLNNRNDFRVPSDQQLLRRSQKSDAGSVENDDLCLDPVSFEVLADPYIDQCGHTFNRNTLQNIDDKAKQQGGQPICPFSRRVINMNAIVPNLFAKEAVKKMLKDARKINSLEKKLDSSVNALKQEMETLKQKPAQIVYRDRPQIIYRDRQCDCAEQVNQFRTEINQYRNEITGMTSTLRKNQDQMESLKTKVKEISDLPFCDRVACIFDSSFISRRILN